MATFAFAIDRGGTFTDVYAEWDDGGKRCCRVLKLLSEDPSNYPDAPTEGIRRILEDVTGKPHPRGSPVDTSRIASIRMGTTVATNALLERNGARVALVITAGFRDLLYIGNQSRPKLFDLRIRQARHRGARHSPYNNNNTAPSIGSLARAPPRSPSVLTQPVAWGIRSRPPLIRA